MLMSWCDPAMPSVCPAPAWSITASTFTPTSGSSTDSYRSPCSVMVRLEFMNGSRSVPTRSVPPSIRK